MYIVSYFDTISKCECYVETSGFSLENVIHVISCAGFRLLSVDGSVDLYDDIYNKDDLKDDLPF